MVAHFYDVRFLSSLFLPNPAVEPSFEDLDKLIGEDLANCQVSIFLAIFTNLCQKKSDPLEKIGYCFRLRFQ